MLAALLFIFFYLRAWARQLPPSPERNVATTPDIQPAAWWMQRHQQKLVEARAGGVDLLFVGDSITQNYEKASPALNEVFLPIWNEFFAPHHALNLGFSGDQTQHVLWRLAHDETDGLAPKDVVVLIGTNNTNVSQSAEDTTAGVIAVIEDLHLRLPEAKILVIGILPSGISARKTAADTQVNAAVKARYRHSTYAKTLDLGSLFLNHGELDPKLFYDPELAPPMPPLHPNTVGQRKMAEAVAKALYP